MRTSDVMGSLLATMVMAAGVQAAPVSNQRDLDTLDARTPQLTGIVDALEDAFKGASSASKGLKTSKTTEKEAQSSSSSGSGGETVVLPSVDVKRSPQLTGIVDALEDAFKGASSASKGLKTSKTTEKEAQSSSSSGSGGETVSIPSMDVKRAPQFSGIIDALEDAFKGTSEDASSASKSLKTSKTTEKEAKSSSSSGSSGGETVVVPSMDIKRQLSGIVDALEDVFKGTSTASKGLKSEAQSGTSSSSSSSSSGAAAVVMPSVDV